MFVFKRDALLAGLVVLYKRKNSLARDHIFSQIELIAEFGCYVVTTLQLAPYLKAVRCSAHPHAQ
jgi:hypothetical protein